MNEYTYIDLNNLQDEHIGKNIMISGRVHYKRDQKKVGFMIIRKQLDTLQCVAVKNILLENYNNLLSIPSESYIYLYGVLNKLPENVGRIKSCSYDSFELVIHNFELVSEATNLPFSLDDANEMNIEERDRNYVLQSTKLDNRSFDLRTPMNNCIFKLQSGICQIFRNYLTGLGFIEIHTPKIIGTASEGGAQVFPIKYFERYGYLAQSPQLYKQMCINSDFDRVFEIGHVYRAENTHSHRHLCEFIGLDVEYAITPNNTYEEIFTIIWNLLDNIVSKMKSDYNKEYDFFKRNYNFEELVFPKNPLVIDFKQGVSWLNENGFEQSNLDDLSTENERNLGKIIKQKFNSDLFILNKYPTHARPFYTMPNDEDNNYSNSYDVIMRGEEISSGAQRIHNYQQLLDNIINKKINPESLKDYLNSFATGSKPHCGFGLGLERILMLILDLKNIRKVSLFPRDPNRISP